ncbi:hypothetical protein D9613_006478 [Agrocybe pediades]|uniref:Hexosyltransferase n=1 Tax=Agrocybe pediades TaxID=84607 RepID=A0A8H4QJ07_9AGAR|nr:hypothetical protein D9613_006478 [Agrocybe pediades]
MYPPTSRSTALYTSLPTTNPDDGDLSARYGPSTSFRRNLRGRLLAYSSSRRVRWVLCSVMLALLYIAYRYFTRPFWAKGTFKFDEEPRPAYLDDDVLQPLVIRLAIISRADEFEVREALREAMLTGISQRDVELEYKFFVGKPTGLKKFWTSRRLSKEMEEYEDVVVTKISDTKSRLSERRLVALKWTGSVSHHRYDYSMTIDSDTFCRFHALVRRLQHLYPKLKPRQEPIVVGRMNSHLVYWENEIADTGEESPAGEDAYFTGPWYSYPMGIGYLISSNLTETLLNAQRHLPHHINYPWDDVMIGAWISSLKEFHNTEAEFKTTLEHPPYAIHEVKPKPILPYPVESTVLDDPVGWHDFVGRKGGAVGIPIGWDTVCIHRMRAKEMRAYRLMKEIKDEWEEGSYVVEEA